MADQEQISSGGFSKTTNFKWLAVGSSFVSWAVISLQDLNHNGELPTIHVTDEKVERSFCSKCGSSISYFQRDGDSIDITVGTMDNPSSVKPSKHIWDRKRIH